MEICYEVLEIYFLSCSESGPTRILLCLLFYFLSTLNVVIIDKRTFFFFSIFSGVDGEISCFPQEDSQKIHGFFLTDL